MHLSALVSFLVQVLLIRDSFRGETFTDYPGRNYSCFLIWRSKQITFTGFLFLIIQGIYIFKRIYLKKERTHIEEDVKNILIVEKAASHFSYKMRTIILCTLTTKHQFILLENINRRELGRILPTYRNKSHSA